MKSGPLQQPIKYNKAKHPTQHSTSHKNTGKASKPSDRLHHPSESLPEAENSQHGPGRRDTMVGVQHLITQSNT